MEVVRQVEVQAPSNPYTATIESGLLTRAGELLRALLPDRSQYFVITVPPVKKLWADILSASLTKAELVHTVFEMTDGERAKSLDTVRDLATKLVRRDADRKSAVIALGGGVVGDVAGFLASIYMRGIDVVQVPTTFLAQVDASIGGKTGVDLPEGKNLLGTFHQPRAVLIDPGVLASVSERDYRAGLYEAMKCGIILRPDIFNFMEQNRERILQREPEAMEWLIAECVQVKAEVVAADERESGLRRILNFGHTVGHALEAETGYKHFLHGEAVGFGMRAAVHLAEMSGHLSAEDAVEMLETLAIYGPIPPLNGISAENLAARLVHDKKTVRGAVHFVIPTRIGEARVVSGIDEKTVLEAIRSAIA